MKLHHLHIHRFSSGALSGSVSLEGPAGEIKVVLNDEGARKVIAACADALITTATEAAANLRESVVATVDEAVKA